MTFRGKAASSEVDVGLEEGTNRNPSYHEGGHRQLHRRRLDWAEHCAFIQPSRWRAVRGRTMPANRARGATGPFDSYSVKGHLGRSLTGT